MDNQWLFLAKLFLFSGLISLAIKYLLPLLNLPATTAVALGLVLTPPMMMAGLLAWRQSKSQNQSD